MGQGMTARGEELWDVRARPFVRGRGQSCILPVLFLSHAHPKCQVQEGMCVGQGKTGEGQGARDSSPDPNHPTQSHPSPGRAPHPVLPPEQQRGTYQGCHEAERGWQEAVPGHNGTGAGVRVGQEGLGRPPQGPPRPSAAPQLLSWAPLTPRCCHTAGEELGNCSRVFYSCWGLQ